ncbi:MAG TPA: hypothetical protein VFG07_08875 [Thermoplasmata archaeon]|nr:hypothetical protein [Thermoplasmata archaeon]
MVEKDEYDRAWELREAANREEKRRDSMRPAIQRATRITVITLLGLGLLLVALGAESLATLDACIADPVCLSMAWDSTFEEFFGILSVGIALSVYGIVRLTVKLRVEPVTGPS